MSLAARIRRDIRDRLLRTDAFQLVRGRLPEDFGFSSANTPAAVVEPVGGKDRPLWDGGDGIGVRSDGSIAVVLIARDNDPEACDDIADGLLETLKAAIDGRSLADATDPDLTYVAGWAYLKPQHPERRIRCVVEYTATRQGWAEASQDE